MSNVEAIKKALEGVTPGPWRTFNGTDIFPDDDDTEGRNHIADCSMSDEIGGTMQRKNATYIAAVNPVAISELLATLEALQRENDKLAKDLKAMRDRYEHWVPITEKIPPGMHPHSLLEFYCVRDEVEGEESPEYWITGMWDEKPADAVFWCAIVSPLGPREITFIARQALASTGGEHNAE